MPSKVDLFIAAVLGKIVRRWRVESDKVWSTFARDIREIWFPDGISFRTVSLLVFDILRNPDEQIGRLVDTVDVTKEFFQDLALVPHRIGARVADDLIPVPPEWETRVVRAPQMMRFLTQEALLFAINIVDADLPEELDIAKNLEKAKQFRDALEALQEGDLGRAFKIAKRSLVGLILFALASLLQTGAALGVVAWIGWTMLRMFGPDGKAVLDARALPQDSRRVRRRRPGKRQFRINRNPGKDR